MQWLVGLLLVQVSITVAEPYYGKEIGVLRTVFHGVSGTVRAADSQTLVIENFNYDGTAPDAFVWIGTTSQPDSTGTIAPVVPGSETKLGEYRGTNLVAYLPGSMTVQDYKWISIWCRNFSANFGDVYIPDSFRNPAPHDLGALPTRAHRVKADNVQIKDARTLIVTNLFYDGNGPDAYFWADTSNRLTSQGTKLIFRPGLSNAGSNQRLRVALDGEDFTVAMPPRMTIYDFKSFGLWCVAATQNFGSIAFDPATINVPAVLDPPPTYPNCEVLLEDEFQVQWRINAEDSSITVEMAGRVTPGNYLAFGLSGSENETLMDGSDVVVGWLDENTMSPMVVDYNLQSKAQCSINDGRGACPDDIQSVGGANNVMLGDVLFDGGIKRLSYKRPLDTGDSTDQVIPTDRPVFISWAIGPINPDGRVAKHVRAPSGDIQINFGRGSSSCPALTDSTGGGSQLPAWPAPTIKDVTEFRVEIGQSGGVRGYTGITGKTGWGIAWYVNGLLIPEITVKRGVNYTFTVFGGDDSEKSAQYHPFYITDDSEGGYAQKTSQGKASVTIYAGETEGPYCSWQESESGVNADDYNSFDAYKMKLERVCTGSSTNGGKLYWTPDENTPDVVYYQCYTHRFLGWKINVSSASGLEISLTLLLAMLGFVTLF
ncbi:protein Skeletor, isoforms B/C-like [Patiria miniata]|uniref:Protein Skeletor n=1 Tax=Patiria miniata TaxID=46514 RepID=A0A914AMQ7_PATMI|nr:protein Skeletor, isoforms B/C-like [Patiria miniata]XP_038065031.1 protein Skeletor, isoforms B/C-like [Patiria miniata]